MRWFLVVLLGLSACNGRTGDDTDSDTVETDYRVDGVRVVIENGNGPKESIMADAVEVYREAVLEQFVIDAATEAIVWAGVAEIRWDDDLVPPVGGTYDFETAKLRLEYHGCIIDPPLYELLATHYHYELSAETTLPAEDILWAEDLSGANTILCAR